MTPSRRAYLSGLTAAAAGSLAGCGGSVELPDLSVRNFHGKPHTVGIVVHAGERRVFARRFELPADPREPATVDDVFENPGRFRVRVRLDGELARTVRWNVRDPERQNHVTVAPDGSVETGTLEA